MANNSLNVTTVKYFVLATKVLPIFIAVLHFANTVFGYLDITQIPLNYLGGISLSTLAYLYLASYTFKLCNYYRMFLHYSVSIDVINIIDDYFKLPISDIDLLNLYIIITGITLLIIIYLKFFK